MRSEWNRNKLIDVCERVSVGYVGPTVEHFCPRGVGVPIVRSQNVRPGNLDIQDARYVTHEFHRKNKKSQLKPGDILFVRVGQNRGDCCVVPEGVSDLNCANIVFARPDRNYSGFLGHYFRSPLGQHSLASVSTGSAQGVLNTNSIAELYVPIPPVAEALGISRILSSLDHRIQCLIRTTETLENIAQAIFKSWFVDFDPVLARAEGREQEGMDVATSALFPSKFEGSRMGIVPSDWQVRTIGDCVRVGRGASPRPIQHFMNGEFPWIKIADATAGNGTFIFETKEHVTREGAAKSVQVNPGDLIMSNSASCGIPVFAELHGYIHDGWLHFRDYQYVTKSYLYYWLKHISAHLVHIADGSVQKNLNIALVGNQPILIPPPAVMARFDQFAVSIIAKMRNNSELIQTLKTISGTLLPRLVSGELRVPEAEKMVEAVL